MNARQPGVERVRSIDDLHHLRLKALVGDDAASRSTADLDVAHRTLAASPGSGRLTRRMRAAQDRALLAGGWRLS